MEFLNIDLRLCDWDQAAETGVAEVLQSPAGESQRYRFQLNVGSLGLGGTERLTASKAAIVGRGLAGSVLSGSAATLWHVSHQIARERDRGLRLRLHVDDWELAQLPWELMYDEHRDDFLVFDPCVSLVRYVRLYAVPPALRQSSYLKVLVAVAAPVDQVPLDWRREVGLLRGALGAMTGQGRIEVKVCEHTTRARLQSHLSEFMPDVVHYVGHAEYDGRARRGALALEGDNGASALLGATDAARLLRRYGTNLIVLNACNTAQGAWAGLSPALVRAEIPAVVSMQWPIDDRAAVRFGQSFYRALSAGKTIDECVSEARVGLNAASGDPEDWAAPVLFLRSLSGQLWTRAPIRAPNPAPGRVRPGRESAVPPHSAGDPGDHGLEGQPHFKTRGPLLASSDDDIIIDRPELQRALRLARQPLVTQYIAFLSARQTGKTTLLLRLMRVLQKAYACVFIDLSVLRAQDATTCFQYVASRLADELKDTLLSGTPLADPEHLKGPVDFLRFLVDLSEVAGLPRIVVLVDEVGALTADASDGLFNVLRTAYTQGRGLTDSLAKYLFVFSGAVDLYDLTHGAASPLNICERIYLHDFSRSEAEQLVRGFDAVGVPVSRDALDSIYELSGGHPYLTMRLCAIMEEAGVQEVSVEAVEAAAQEMLIGDDNIRYVIRKLEDQPDQLRRLREIVVEGRTIPFSRNDPGLATLEMIGVIRPVQPCAVRNELYRRALLQYLG